MSRRFALVYEAPADFAIASELADRVLLAEIGWLDDDGLLQTQRQWVGDQPPGERLTWKSMGQRARAARIRAHGHFRGEPGLPDAQAARRALLYLLNEIPALDAIVLVRDADDQPERKRGIEQAREALISKCAIVIGVAITERECWVLSGFEASDDQERERLESQSRTLGFNPCVHSHQLTACKDDKAKKSPKRVLRELSKGDGDRERVCWQATPLDVLMDRGKANGLADYLGEVRQRLVPLITGAKSK